MKIIDLVKKLDRMVEKGQIMEAFEEFFSEDVITHSSAGDRSEGKAQKRGFLQGFFANMVATDSVKLHDTVIDDNKSFSAFTFKFRNKQNERLVWNEIIRRTWLNGQVIDEYYYEGDIDQLKKEIKTREKTEKKATEKAAKTIKKLSKETVKATKAPAHPDIKSPAKVATVIKKAATPKTNKADKKTTADKQNLKLVEGIGPKIEQLLNAEGIKTYQDLATTKKAKLEAVLSAAGPRFSMHSPETWPMQAKLLAAGKKDELKKLQDELKGGRKV